MSLSARRAWIEIMIHPKKKKHNPVALRKESVDRNNDTPRKKKINPVALRKESVDRNIGVLSRTFCSLLSLSARRAWIEMYK